jgi:Uncharacterized protein conserved in bacteria (DUF2225)
MTDIGEEIVTCAVCGRQSPQTILFSTSTFGAPDLDLRPPPMKRQTIEYWVQECPHCGYVACNISDADSRTRRFLQGDGWKALNHSKSAEGRSLSSMFLVHSEIQEAICEVEESARAALHASWAADDKGDQTTARSSRRRAADLFKRALSKGEINSGQISAVQLMVIDALRRAQCWDEALEYSRNVDARILDQAMKAVLNFQQHLCVAHDAECYDMSSAVNFAKLPP